MLFDYLMDHIENVYVKDELRKWSERFVQGVKVTGHRVETIDKKNGTRILFGNISIIMSDEQARQLSFDLASINVEKQIRKISRDGSGK
jgi:hypothetical protein